MSAEQQIREAHRLTAGATSSGAIQDGVLSCICGARWYDADADCPVMERDLDALADQRMSDDGAPHHDGA